MSRIVDLTGLTFGLLTVIERNGTSDHGKSLWLCSCRCGGECTVIGGNIVQGKTTSCGCVRSEQAGALKFIDGRRSHPLYEVWSEMKRRCLDPRRHNFKWYGAKGVKVCDRWLNSFEAFLEDMGPRPVDENAVPFDIDRIKSDGNYEPANCRWLPSIENKRRAQLERWQKEAA